MKVIIGRNKSLAISCERVLVNLGVGILKTNMIQSTPFKENSSEESDMRLAIVVFGFDVEGVCGSSP